MCGVCVGGGGREEGGRYSIKVSYYMVLWTLDKFIEILSNSKVKINIIVSTKLCVALVLTLIISM